MRLFEILTFAATLSLLIILLSKQKKKRLLACSAGIAAGILLIHIILEGYRWQMVPVYSFIIVLFTISLTKIFSRRRRSPDRVSLTGKILRYTGISLSFLLLVLMSIPPLFLPVFKLPEPGGPYAIGTATFFFTDTNRPDLHSGEPEQYRELSVRVWYPAEPEQPDKPVPYVSKDEAEYMAAFQHLPPFFMDHLNLVNTSSYRNAMPVAGKFPVVLYSPSGDLVQNTALFQELASHGYVVISVGHPYWNAFYYNSRGEAVPFDNQHPYYQAMWEEEGLEIVNSTKEEITTAPDLVKKREAQKKLNRYMPLEIADIRLWSGDLSFLLDQFREPAQEYEWLMGHMDTENLGVIGFSKGGAAAAQFCVTDTRCNAGINLSGFIFGDAVERPFTIPFMIMENQEEWCTECAPICEVFYEDAKNDAYMLRIEGARHGNFSDWSLIGRFLRIIGVTGPINGHRFLEIQNRYVTAFMDLYLKGVESPVLNSSGTEYPEVTLSSRNTAVSQSQ